MPMKISGICQTTGRRLFWAAPFALILLFRVLVGAAQAPSQGVARPLAEAKFTLEDDVKCLYAVRENGDPDTGPSTFLLKTPPKCVVPPHFHTAEEQLIVVRGEVSTGMEGMRDTVLGSGGFAMMPGKKPHWFSCVSKTECLMFVTFDRKYDVTWIKQK